MYLTEHFSKEEMTITQVRDVDNSCPPTLIIHLRNTAIVLEQVREILGGRPITVNSGYRCPAVNKAVGGADNSAHMQAYAVDFICPSFGTPLDICRALEASRLGFDQVIEEGTWVHISIAPPLRRQILTKQPGGGYSVGLQKTV